MRRYSEYLLTAFLFGILLIASTVAAETNDSDDQASKPWVVMASGGGTQTIGNLTIGATIGQGCVGTLSLPGHNARIGFWQNFASGCCVGVRGNIDGSADNVIDIIDLTYLVAFMFKDGDPPGCLDEADVNGMPAPIDILDLTYLVDYMFKSGPSPLPCP